MSGRLWIAFTVLIGLQEAARALEIPQHPTEAPIAEHEVRMQSLK